MNESLFLEAGVVNEGVIWSLAEDYIFEVVGEIIYVGIAVVGEIVEGGVAEEG